MLNLEIPNETEVKEEIRQELLPTVKEEQAIASVVDAQTAEIMNVDINSNEQRQQFINVMESFGEEIVVKSEKKNSLLQTKVGDLSKAGGEAGPVAKNLEELTLKMKDLDPSGLDFTKTGYLGKIFNPVRRYFEKYKSADQEIATIVKSMDNGKKNLLNDNTTLVLEQNALRDMTKELQKKIELGMKLDSSISYELEKAKVNEADPEKIKFVEEDLLYPLRQRITDFQQLSVVNQQGIIAMELIVRNNKELIRSVDRAKLVTVNALKTAVTLAAALYNEKIVLDKVNALNDATNSMIESTSRMLKEQGTEIHRQASESSISLDTLKQSFADTMDALNEINTYKNDALPKLESSINEFQTLVIEGQKEIDRIEENKNLI